jgi:hypothetical protein
MKRSTSTRTFPLPAITLNVCQALRFLLVFPLVLVGLVIIAVPTQAQPPTWCGNSGQSDIAPEECLALEDLFESTSGDNWVNNDGWLDSTAVCTDWYGVTCDDAGEHVVILDLNSNNLDGTIPASLNDLTALVSLDLTNNQLSGSIPTSLGSLSNLTALSLGSNQLDGSIPTELSQLEAITTLDLGRNRLSGSIPESLSQLTTLTGYLYLDGNQLEGPIPAGICSLNLLPSNVDYNMLDVTDPPAVCDDIFGDWRDNQTVPPTAIEASEVVINTVQDAAAVTADVTVTWLPIAYTEDGGGYEVWTRDIISNQEKFEATTETSGGKAAAELTVTIPGDPTKFAYFVRTSTPAHAGNQNDLLSVGSEEAFIDTNAISIVELEAGTPLLYLPALAPLLLLVLTGAAIIGVNRKPQGS